jgi:isopentenyl phosphate kinase
MKYLKLFEGFYKNDNDAIYHKSENLKELETSLSDILNELDIDGFEWLGFTHEAGSFGITNVDVNIYSPVSGKNLPFRFSEIKNTISHLHSYLSESGLKLKGCNIVTGNSEKSIKLSNSFGITYQDLSNAFSEDGVKFGGGSRNLIVLKLSFGK